MTTRAAAAAATERTARSGRAPVLPTLPAVVEGVVRHDRLSPLTHGFRYRIYQWLVDLDHLPDPPRWLRPFVGFRAGDHLGDPGGSIRANVEAFCATRGVDVTGGRIVLLANARVLGHVFNPLSVFWCLDDEGAVRCVVAEVHNTYGERHAYLLEDLSPSGQTSTATTDKAFYVSPFLSVDGGYDLRFGLGSDTVSTAVRLRQDDRVVFTASFRGAPAPATVRRIVSALVRMPFMTQRVSALIRIQGVRLWLRQLPVVRRQPHHHQEGVQ